MMKWMRYLLIFGLFIVLFAGPSKIQADAKLFPKSFATDLKNGTLPGTVGKVGTKFGTIYKKLPGEVYTTESFMGYSTEYDTYYYEHQKSDFIYFSQSTKAIESNFNSKYTKASIRKQLKPLAYQPAYDTYVSKSKTNLYKAGRFYAYIDRSSDGTRAIVATKWGMKNYFMIDKIYE